jgi:predicted AlkP superfamily phosphohydrolase/phosphomutase
MTTRTLLIGLDGATFSILDPCIADGVMPFLGSLFAGGVRAELESVVPPLTPPAWTSLMTGRSPGNHGIFDFLRYEFREDARTLRVADANDVACETIWSVVSRAGLRANVLNFPLTFPAPPIAGNVVPGWVPWRHLRLACYPSHLYDRLKALPGFDARELAMDMALEEKALEGCHREEDYEHAIKVHIRREQQWFKICRYLMTEDPAELTAVLFDGVDKLQHFCWRFIDPTAFPSQPSQWEVKIRDLCLDYFREVDRLMAELVALAGPDVRTIIASDHGFGPTARVFYLNAWLEQNGYLVRADAARVEQKHPETLGLGTMARRFYEIDWEKTTAYCPTPSSNGIYLSAPEGAARSPRTAAERARFRDELRAALLAIRDPSSGEAVVDRIWSREEAFSGTQMALAPDLTLGLSDGGFVSILPSDEVVKPRAEVSGTHRPNGVFAAHGPGIRGGSVAAPLSILDVAPLVLYSLGLPIPDDLEGRVSEEILDARHLQAYPVVAGPPTKPPAEGADRKQDALEADVEDEVIKQLKALGYME